jgi:ATP-dependent exoDNAse (exonuclease V) alpha subunit
LELDGEIVQPLDAVRKHFIHNYCRTCHSFQGLSVGTAITIYDWKCFWANRKWIYTAVTRARSLENVFFVEYKDTRPQETFRNTRIPKEEGGWVSGPRQASRESDTATTNT